MDFKKIHDEIINWIKDWFADKGENSKAVIGISGGKDSTVCAALLVEALGKDRVIGVMMPNGEQKDINDSCRVCDILGIKQNVVNVGNMYDNLTEQLRTVILNGKEFPNNIYQSNTPARLRMSALYGIAALTNGFVCNTCNLSEDWVGYATRYGDGAGDFSPISRFTVTEVKAIGRYLGLPEKYIEKPPIDGLSGKTDEDNLGFTYAVLDKYIREGIEPDPNTKNRIDTLHKANLFKVKYMPCFEYNSAE
jgi:NAD+ synthase